MVVLLRGHQSPEVISNADETLPKMKTSCPDTPSLLNMSLTRKITGHYKSTENIEFIN